MTYVELFNSLDEKRQLHVFIDFIRMATGMDPLHAKKCRNVIIGTRRPERKLGCLRTCLEEYRGTF